MTPDQLASTAEILRRLRHRLVMEATPAEDGSLVPLLKRSSECAALDNAVRLIERELREVSS